MSEPCNRRVQVGDHLSWMATLDGMTIRLNIYRTRPHPFEAELTDLRCETAGPLMGPCPGVIIDQGSGVSHTGTAWRWVGCTVCGWVQRVRDTEPIQEVLL